jgi:hypothetical protein
MPILQNHYEYKTRRLLSKVQPTSKQDIQMNVLTSPETNTPTAQEKGFNPHFLNPFP